MTMHPVLKYWAVTNHVVVDLVLLPLLCLSPKEKKAGEKHVNQRNIGNRKSGKAAYDRIRDVFCRF